MDTFYKSLSPEQRAALIELDPSTIIHFDDQDQYLHLLNKDGTLLRCFKDKPYEACLTAVQQDIRAIEHVPVSMWTEEMMEIIRNTIAEHEKPILATWVANTMDDLDEERPNALVESLKVMIVRKWPDAVGTFSYVDRELVWEAVQVSPRLARSYRNCLTRQMMSQAIRMLPALLGDFTNITREDVLMVLELDPVSVFWKTSHRDDALQKEPLIALLQSNTIYTMTEDHVRENPILIMRYNNPSEELCFDVVSKDPILLAFINQHHQTRELCQHAVKLYPRAVALVKNDDLRWELIQELRSMRVKRVRQD